MDKEPRRIPWPRHWQKLVNLALVLLFGYFIAKETLKVFTAGVHFVDVSFALHNVIFLGAILLRRDHQAVDARLFDQAVALAAFFSGLLFLDPLVLAQLGQRAGPLATQAFSAQPGAAKVVIAASWLLGAVATVSLGRSFGILIAHREVRTGGAYALVRHPLYTTDLLFRLGVVLQHPYVYNVVVALLSSLAYVYRAVLEERFLSEQSPVYASYRERVRYRFVPWLF